MKQDRLDAAHTQLHPTPTSDTDGLLGGGAAAGAGVGAGAGTATGAGAGVGAGFDTDGLETDGDRELVGGLSALCTLAAAAAAGGCADVVLSSLQGYT